MNILKKTTSISIIFFIIIAALLQGCKKNFRSIETANTKHTIRVGVLFSNYNISSIKLLTEDMKKIEQENPGTVEYTFYDGKGDQKVQDDQLEDILSKQNADIITIDIVDATHTKYTINRIKEFNIPVIFAYNADQEIIKSYEKAFLASINPAEQGTLEGDIIVSAWNKNKRAIDKNGDNILSYIMLLGSPNNIISINRAKYYDLKLNSSNIQSNKIGEKYCYWDQNVAKNDVDEFFLRFGNRIEAIITVEDGMAIGAIKSLQEHGYNLGNNEKKIVVIGCDGIPEALDLIKKGEMTGTVVTNTYSVAKDFYTFEMNIYNNKNIIEGTNCTIDSTGKLVTIPLDRVVTNLD